MRKILFMLMLLPSLAFAGVAGVSSSMTKYHPIDCVMIGKAAEIITNIRDSGGELSSVENILTSKHYRDRREEYATKVIILLTEDIFDYKDFDFEVIDNRSISAGVAVDCLKGKYDFVNY